MKVIDRCLFRTQLIFRWENHTKYPFYSKEDHLGIKTSLHKLQTELYGIDPRLLEISDDKFLVVYSLYGKHVGKGGMVLAGYEKNVSNNSTMEFYLRPNRMFLDNDRNSKQKNWMPFLFNNTPHFIQRFRIALYVGVFARFVKLIFAVRG